MNEALLQYLWRYSLISPTGLYTTAGEPVTILHPGKRNTDSGPDFLEAKIKISDTTWVGNVELHIRSSDWAKHQHQQDTAYRNIILHVVYEANVPWNEGLCPELEVRNNLPHEIIERYRDLISRPRLLPCASQLPAISNIEWGHWLERLLAERWEQKLIEWKTLLHQEFNDWRSLLYYRLAANFGFHVNRDAFLMLARSLPLNILSRHRSQLLQLEALLFGQAGLLPAKPLDEYSFRLEAEYHFLRRKYELQPIPVHVWRFMRLRPYNFPTIRIAQFAALMHQDDTLFSQITEGVNTTIINNLLQVPASDYWNDHYRFGILAKENTIKTLGTDATENIMINTIAPMRYLFALENADDDLLEKSTTFLQSVPAENNRIIREWKRSGRKPEDAAQSQAMIQLFQQYCESKRCLQCAVGNQIIKKNLPS